MIVNLFKQSRFFQILNIILFSVLLFTFNSCSFSASKTRKYLNESYNKEFDLIIVPGVPYYYSGWDRIMKARVYWSKYLFEKGIAKNVMYSGSSVYSPYTEAVIMSLYAEAIGIPKKNIFIETRAEHSTENVYYSYKKAKKLGFNNIALASDPFQTKMLKRFIKRKVYADVTLLPIVFDTLRAMNPKADPQIDFKQAFNENFIPLPDRKNFWKRLKGTLGNDLDTNAYK
jgi:uncharacterized SAM-binding protein YcdF (DUF218 family)